MSWICKKCETENPDSLDVCEVCETHAPKIVDFQYDKVLSGKPITIRWKTEHCDNVSIYYKGETIDVSGKETYIIDIPDERDISFILSNSEITTRTVSFTMEFIERPSISFTSDKSKLRSGRKELSTLSWKINNARKAYLIFADNNIEIPFIGKLEVSPNVTTTYLIKTLALDDESSFTEELQIGVFNECEIDFKADKYFILPKIPVVLSWNVTNSKNVWFDYDKVEDTGYKVVEPDKATVFVLKAEDEFGIKEKRIDIQMLPLPQVKSLLVPIPVITNNLTVNIKQPRYSVNVRFPKLDIDWIKAEIPKVPSLTDLGINVELSPPLIKSGLQRLLKSVYNHIKSNSNGK